MSAAKKLPHLKYGKTLTTHVSESVIEVFKSTFEVDAQLIEVHQTKNYTSVGDVSGICGMMQDRLEGKLVISFSQAAISNILSRIYDRRVKADDDIAKQGAAELTNMIYGRLKLRLNNNGFDLRMTLPSVVVGPGHSIHHQSCEETAVFVFKFDNKYTFDVAVAIHD
jgi:chemotaxis protein CheX